MKRLLLLVSICALSIGCKRMNVLVDHDYRFSENFKDYSSYTFVDCEMDTNFFCSDIQQAIARQMTARGYNFNAQGANLYVNFAVYDDKFQYKGYDQPQLVNWLINKRSDESVYTPIKYQLGKGTLMISMIEASTSQIVWRGYASGIYSDQMQKKNYFKNIVRTIFDEYPLFASGKERSNIRRLKFDEN